MTVLKAAPDDSVAVVRPELSHRRRGAVERLLGWLYMGPLGHLYSVAADLAVYFVRWVIRGTRRRLGRE